LTTMDKNIILAILVLCCLILIGGMAYLFGSQEHICSPVQPPIVIQQAPILPSSCLPKPNPQIHFYIPLSDDHHHYHHNPKR
jgi:hypothetical protein